MEPMLPQSLGGSDSEILGVGDVMMNSPDMNAGLIHEMNIYTYHYLGIM